MNKSLVNTNNILLGIFSCVFLISFLLVSTSMAYPAVGVRASRMLANPGRSDTYSVSMNEIDEPFVQTVELYGNINFRGTKTVLVLNESSCVNLQGELNDSISSVDAQGGCVILCPDARCRGTCEQIEFYSSDLSRVNLNDKVSSVKGCNAS